MTNLPIKTPEPLRIPSISGGVNYSDEQSTIRDTQSPYLLNCLPDEQGNIEKRPGQSYVYATSLGAGATHYYGDYTKQDGTTKTLIHHGTKLYTQTAAAQPVEILTGLANAKGFAFVYNDIWYYGDGTNYVQDNGTTAAAVVGYIPTITTDRNPDGTSGAGDEDLNLLSNSWKDQFLGDGTTEYTLSDIKDADGNSTMLPLSATLLLAWVNGVAKTEDTGSGGDFTVNRTTGVVTFGTAPANDAVVVIQAEKASLNDATVITKCKRSVIFGGANDTHVFLFANPDYPVTLNYNGFNANGVSDPTYWPVNNFQLVGADSDPVANAAVLYDQLVILKNRSIYRMDYDQDTTPASFPNFPLNNAIGCDMPESVQIVDNNLVFCNTYSGAHILTRTDIRTEKNIAPLSGNVNYGTVDGVNVGLLQETKANLQAATSVDWNGFYILCVGTKAWAWHYRRTPYLASNLPSEDEDRLAWYPLTGINANCWHVRDNVLHCGDRTIGMVAKFSSGQWNDFGVAIDARARTKAFYFGVPEYQKTISKMKFRSRESANTKISVVYITDKKGRSEPIDVISKSFSWENFSWGLFSWRVFIFPPVFPLRPKQKKSIYFQVEFYNNTLNQNLSVMDLVINYAFTKEVK